jgi:hypothetical protein
MEKLLTKYLRIYLFAKLIFSPPKLVFAILEKVFLSKKKFGGKKISLAKKFINFTKTILPIFNLM